MLKNYINSIEYDSAYGYTFRGDGFGDCEKLKHHCDYLIIPEYIEYCERQIYLAKQYLEEAK